MPNPLTPSALQVWAVEDTSIQLTWGALDAGPVTVTANGATAGVEHPGGPGAIDLHGLTPATESVITVTHRGGTDVVTARTLATPPGEERCRIATISDLHLGSRHWGASTMMRDRSGHPVPFPTRCARAAIDEAIAWGAQLLVVKGDGAHHQSDRCFDELGRLLDGYPDLPVLLLPGNHDVDGKGSAPLPDTIGQRAIGYIRTTDHRDLPGARIIAADTTIDRRGVGTVEPVADAVTELAGGTADPYLVLLHHHLHPYRVPIIYPLGVPHGEAERFLDRLGGANRRGLVSSGHTHRNRARRRGPLTITEVGSTRDWPGVWAGYVVHDGGLRQVVRRAAAPDAISWHEYSRRALLGVWEWWAQGPLEQRCFTVTWPR